MKHHLLAPATQRRGRLALTLAASLVFHGSLVGVAALWPYHIPPKFEPLPPIVGVPDDPLPPIPDTPEPSTPEPRSMDLAPIDPVVPEPPLDANPPLAWDPEMVEPQPATPAPTRPAAPTRPVRSPRSPSNQAAPRSPVTTVRSGSLDLAPGAVRPGATSWSVSSKPAYPMSLKAAGIHGSGVVRVTTDNTGRVVAATMTQSTGNSQLDENTCRHARAFWTGPAGSVRDIPITYQLH